MPPHCDSKDGPVVKAAALAISENSVELVLPYVPESGEAEVQAAFERTMAARVCSPEAAQVADEWFYETVVRIHRAGEGAAFTGLKPAGLGHGEVVPLAERAIETGQADELVGFLLSALEREIRGKFDRVMQLQLEQGSVPEVREYVEAMLGFEVWAHKTHQCIASDPLHEHGSMRHAGGGRQTESHAAGAAIVRADGGRGDALVAMPD